MISDKTFIHLAVRFVDTILTTGILLEERKQTLEALQDVERYMETIAQGEPLQKFQAYAKQARELLC